MFLQACVENSVHIGGGVLPREPTGRHPPPGQTPPQLDTPCGQTPPLGRQPPPIRRPLQQMVHIPLECTLVYDFFL